MFQFTGLKDKNGKEIYDGDILRFAKIVTPYFGKNKGKQITVYDYWEVFFMEQKGEWRTRRNEQIDRLYSKVESHEVIGNIYENADLLK